MARSPAGQSLDLINIMSYDAGDMSTTGFDPLESFRSHRTLFPNQVLTMGVQVPPEAWGGNVVTLTEVETYAKYSIAFGGGMMLWAMQKAGTPSAQAISTTICNTYNMGNCTAPMLG